MRDSTVSPIGVIVAWRCPKSWSFVADLPGSSVAFFGPLAPTSTSSHGRLATAATRQAPSCGRERLQQVGSRKPGVTIRVDAFVRLRAN